MELREIRVDDASPGVDGKEPTYRRARASARKGGERIVRVDEESGENAVPLVRRQEFLP